MATYGAKYPCFKSNTGTASGVVLGKLVSADVQFRIAEGEFYADDELDDFVAELTGADIDLELNDLSDTNEATLFGSTKDQQNVIHINNDDSGPYGTFAFYRKKLSGGTTSYEGFAFTKVRAKRSKLSAKTKAQSTQLSGVPIQLVAMPDANGDVVLKETFQTAESCVTWIKSKVNISP